MMFRNITVVLAISEREILRYLAERISAMTFAVAALDSTYQVLEYIHDEKRDADILLVSDSLVNGDASIIFNQWKIARGGPICVLVTSQESDTSFLGKGADNCLHVDLTSKCEGDDLPIDIAALSASMMRYAKLVELQAIAEGFELYRDKMNKQLTRLWVATITLAIVLAASIGPTYLPKLFDLLSP